MRTYPRNSPQAAARIVALALTSDGHVCSSEERALEKLDIAGQLGLAPEQFAQIVQNLCEDHSVGHTSLSPSSGQLDTAMLATLIDEIDDPALRRKVMRLCAAVVIADNHLADGEIALLAAILKAWGVAPERLVDSRGGDQGPARAQVRAAAIT
ncbi:TerB family tellurite resistance protein [Paraburkholderia sp. BCC1884]|uniref:TerB family tellurite resistance protein n=1 Tax=Paraburkholderia sp. BCC1884 TaxID=2562668 RepID=UPI001182C10D|nr:TerB family tellurite resistance protein [Paraburkholderia sp. BCC1884]